MSTNDKVLANAAADAWKVLHAAHLTLGWVSTFEGLFKSAAVRAKIYATGCQPDHKPLALNRWAGWYVAKTKPKELPATFALVQVCIHDEARKDDTLSVRVGLVREAKRKRSKLAAKDLIREFQEELFATPSLRNIDNPHAAAAFEPLREWNLLRATNGPELEELSSSVITLIAGKLG